MATGAMMTLKREVSSIEQWQNSVEGSWADSETIEKWMFLTDVTRWEISLNIAYHVRQEFYEGNTCVTFVIHDLNLMSVLGNEWGNNLGN